MFDVTPHKFRHLLNQIFTPERKTLIGLTEDPDVSFYADENPVAYGGATINFHLLGTMMYVTMSQLPAHCGVIVLSNIPPKAPPELVQAILDLVAEMGNSVVFITIYPEGYESWRKFFTPVYEIHNTRSQNTTILLAHKINNPIFPSEDDNYGDYDYDSSPEEDFS